ncbi:toprim domain-containing protein [Halomonas lysinitropha]|uniref:DNA primase TraC n=1 Tax=Halomonas lysinitropha TaxID=2607506 RepID=A0A5K1I9F7_9GAMM|nr:toprim domain-containing protein [Halomonas lysinitropha]VVZ96748.1 DNA primase TraC [Halomonas lysinitropha]
MPYDAATTIEAALVDALAARGVAGLAIRADGEVHRFDAPDKRRGNLAGWYVCPTLEVAVFGFWHTGEQQAVTLAGEHDPQAAEQARQAAERARRERLARREQEHAQAAAQARQRWEHGRPPDPGHAYLKAKEVKPYGLRQQGDTLLVPLFFNGALVNLQRIAPDGGKRFLPRARLKDTASLVGRLAGAGRVYLAEGWATAATLHEATGHPVVAAMTANNLATVARTLRQRLPSEVAITVAADNDQNTPGNPGITAAREAAQAIHADLTWPRFPCVGCACSDFNDLARCQQEGGT